MVWEEIVPTQSQTTAILSWTFGVLNQFIAVMRTG